jgi:DNA-binding NtrC family response regulator
MSLRKILVLDDEPSVAALYTVALESAGHQVIKCTSYEDARAHLKTDAPEGLLADVRVGEFNGLQLAHFFRSISPEGLLMVVSGHDDVVIRKEAEKIGATFLLKPIDIDELTKFFAIRRATVP